MGGVGEGEAAREDAAVAGAEFAAVERDRGDLRLGRADLDPPADEARVERVVVSVEAQVGLGGDARDETAIGVGQLRRQPAHPLALGGEALRHDGPRGAVDAAVDLGAPGVELGLEVERVGKQTAGLEVAVDEAVVALGRALGLGVARIEDDPAEREPAAVAGEGPARSPAAGVDPPSRSQTNLFGNAPSVSRQRFMPQAMSSHPFEKTSAPAKARE
jgi:hypothetical protein